MKVLSWVHRALIQIFFYLLPLSIGAELLSLFSKPGPNKTFLFSIWGDGFGSLLVILILLWTLSSLYFFLALIFSKAFREELLVKLARIREDDEREEQIVGKATKSSFLFSLAVALALFAAANCRYQSSTDGAKPYSSFVIDNFHLLDQGHDSTVQTKINDQDYVLQSRDLPLSKSAIILLMIIVQIASYQFFSRKYLKETNG